MIYPFYCFLPDLLVYILISYLLLKRKFSLDKFFFLFFLGLILYLTLFPLIYNLFFLGKHEVNPYNFYPFIDLINNMAGTSTKVTAIKEIFLNIFLYFPASFFGYKLFKQNKTKVFMTFVLLSCLIEAVQPQLSQYRRGDITDVITNAFGSLLALFVYLIYSKLTNKD